jgi:demethylmenaquinone methyltransferase/2-methoxy-6-polyprenyl-1,4-benzoquinol methylase
MADLLAEQIAYYDARAGEYDDFWLRRGAYALEEPLASQWADDAADTERVVANAAHGDVLELACGTGLFTRLLVEGAASVHAVDASADMLAHNRARLGDRTDVTREQADLFAWEPVRRYDVVAFSFWLSHVPDELFEPFWDRVSRALAPGGTVVVVDSCPAPGFRVATGSRTERRRLRDGRRFDIVKRYWSPEALAGTLAPLGWTGTVDRAANGLILRALLARTEDGS